MNAIIKKILSATVIILLSVIGLIILYFLIAFCLSRITIPSETGGLKEVTIYIKTNGVHTDLVIPVCNDQMNWSREIKYANTIAKDTTYQYLGIGWGDKEFYMNTPTWSQLKLSVAFKAVFGLGEAVMHTTYYKEMAENEDCRRIVISDEQYSQLIRYVTDGFKKDTNGHFINIPTNMTYGYSDAFYEANGHYNLFFTCNTWVNNALKVSGQKCCLWAVFDTEIFLKYR